MGKIEVLLCSFCPKSGWRVKGVARADSDRIAVVVVDGRKLLQIPVAKAVKGGRFCNPRKLAVEYVRAKWAPLTGAPAPSGPIVLAPAREERKPIQQQVPPAITAAVLRALREMDDGQAQNTG
jgi:hypothetical protein